jgi:putative ABC transport system substrate-binding protein
VIFTVGSPSAQAARKRTHTIPIVFTRVADPIGAGLVASLDHPGGNVTGFAAWDFSIGGKWMQLLREVAPDLTRVGILYNPDTATYAPPLVASAKTAAGNVQVIEILCHGESEMQAGLLSLSKERHGGLVIIPEPFTNTYRDEIIAECARLRLPAIAPLIDAVEHGAPMSYIFSFDNLIRDPVRYIDRILKGATPSDLPVQLPTKYELAINLKTAKTLELTVPPRLLATADKVTE